ncbi:MAG: ShlB/FhaC/HecB family hemolysin secretion/activation protein [Cyanobacteriota bacterium]|nr:ShlB/FhaC/HecB family hemolysin secretion/activation protein [Cyanobacteriota bacterium]
MIARYKYLSLCLIGITYLWGNPSIAETSSISVLKTLKTDKTSNQLLTQVVPETNIEPEVQPQEDPFLQPLPNPTPIPEENQPTINPPAPEEAQPLEENRTFFVQKIEVLRNTILSSEEINAITQTVEGKNITPKQLGEVADKITQLYLDKGYITSRAVLADQKAVNGVFQIVAIEGGIEDIKIIGANRTKESYIRSRIELAKLNPLQKSELEDQLRLLKVDPIFKNVEATLKAGNEFGKSILEVRVKEANAINTAVNFDNYSSPSIGSLRYGVGVAYNNLTGSGDQIYASYNRSTTGGANLYDFGYRLPVNPMNGSLQLRAAFNDYKVTDSEFEDLNIEGNSELYEVSFRQPLTRSTKEEFALSLGFAYRDGQTFLDEQPQRFSIGPDEDGVSRTSVIKFGQDYIKRDPKGAWTGRSQFSLGTGLFDATKNSGSDPDGQFISWLGQAQRVQRLSNDNLLIVRLDLQLTPNSLLSSEQFVIGGGQTLRGYRQNVLYGDNGVRFSVEDRIAVMRNSAGIPTLQVAPFFDLGAIWNNSDNPNKFTRESSLTSLGLGLLWQPIPGLNTRLDYAVPLVNIRDRGDNIQDDGFHFTINYTTSSF